MTTANVPPRDDRSVTFYPDLDEALLKRFVAALETGDTDGLAPRRAEAAEAARGLFRWVRVPGDDNGGVELDAGLWKHPAGEPRPLIVMPSPWGDIGWLMYAIQATGFAQEGYNVLAYTARGFALSGGKVEVAGCEDIADGRRALSYLIDQSGGEFTKAGFLGVSYGSGISQLVAAHDERVSAVVAMSTWGDLREAFYENSTRHIAAVNALRNAPKTARFSERTEKAFADVLADENTNETLEWARERSPLTYVERLNNRCDPVPVYFAHTWHETLFPPNQTLKMFNALREPKRMALSIGDHGSPEISGLLGLPNRIWAEAHRWFAHHLKEDDNGIDTKGQVTGQLMWNNYLDDADTWDAFTGRCEPLYLTGAAEGTDDGTLTDKPVTGWNLTFQAGADTPATVADGIMKTGGTEVTGFPKEYPTGEISRADAGVWTSAPMTAAATLRGIPRLQLTYTASFAKATIVAYLFDVDDTGTANIITHAPYTNLDAEPGQPVNAEIPLQATGYTVRAGHRMMLVLDTKDPFYGDANKPGGTITVTSPDDTPAHLAIPLA
ncbi:CocE/NonD family hydrolase [Streptomyces noursei]|uniref:CocE/NonD family hydrolase n=1 Tax=Streptomyces noursei TaxID=1971 RepID=UPI001964C5B0|nr:CocE/NonD family hydrolase [Streptomyces noursei]QRX89948.1 CocE/NonD family hydrolase [Streptomyces noursei]